MLVKEHKMSKKIGHNYSRDPYPWDDAEKRASSAQWTCCDMKLPATFFICPICEAERNFEDVDQLSDDTV
jgi:hypothetical protein